LLGGPAPPAGGAPRGGGGARGAHTQAHKSGGILLENRKGWREQPS